MIRRGPVATLVAFAAVLTVFVSAAQAAPAKLTVEITNVKVGNGPVMVAVWRDEAKFLNGAPYRKASAESVQGTVTVTFDDLEPGTYAVSSYQDENKNGKLDRNFVGKPKEPYGFSNDARGKFGPPKFRDAKFELKPEGQKIAVRLE